MSRITLKEALTALHVEQHRTRALELFVKDLCPDKGFHFVRSPGFAAYLLHVDEDGCITVYDESIGNEERIVRDRRLWEIAQPWEKQSLIDALADRTQFFTELRRQGVPL